ncbi:MAG: MqnA/MqnD/SBP family protein [Armatimonadota bacterium]
MTPVTIRVGHSPDSDDAFMFYALASHKLDTGPLGFEHILQDIQTLNAWAMEGRLEVTAISAHAYAYVSDRYLLLRHGASMGEGYGPVVVSSTPMRPDQLSGARVAVPGLLTSAYLALRLFQPGFHEVVLPFDQIMEAVQNGQVDAGLLIHEGQITHQSLGMHKVVDLGVWWNEKTGLPLPLGLNAVRRDLGPDLIRQVSAAVRDSIAYALQHREEALSYAMQFGRGLGRSDADRFVAMYVNERTLEIGEDGREAVRLFLQMGIENGFVPGTAAVEFAK